MDQNATTVEFEDVSYRTLSGDEVSKRLPKSRPQAIARLGMAIFDDIGAGAIVGMTPQLCIIQRDDGRQDALTWGDVELNDVAPDSAQVAQASTSEETGKLQAARALLPIIDRVLSLTSGATGDDAKELSEVAGRLQDAYRKLWDLQAEAELSK